MQLLPNTIAGFREQFRNLHDGLIKEICYTPRISHEQQQESFKMTVIAYAKKNEENEWLSLHINFEEIGMFVLKRVPNYSFTLISRADFGFNEDEVYFNFFSKSVKVISPGYYEEQTGLKGPTLFVTAKKCFWSISPYLGHEFNG